MFDEFCQCGHTKEEHVEKWFSKGIKCLGDNCKCNEFRPTMRAADGKRAGVPERPTPNVTQSQYRRR